MTKIDSFKNILNINNLYIDNKIQLKQIEKNLSYMLQSSIKFILYIKQ